MKNKLIIFVKKLFILSSIIISTNSYTEEKNDYKTASEYTINYDNVSMIEYIQFVSKICNVNFIYNNEDLNFTVTVLSKEPITKQNVMSTLIQILRIHDLHLIEDENNIIISKIADINEVFPIVPIGQEDVKNPIITRVFPVKNTSLEILSTIIKPMISKNALLEILPNDRQLVITDVTTNLKKIATLIENLDATENPLIIKSYNIQANTSASLISLTKQIISPLIGDNPFILVAQDSTRTIFIVSTPALVKKTLSILQSLDTPPQLEIKTPENLQIFIYKPIYRTQKEMQNALDTLADNLKKEGHHQNVVEAIHNMNWMDDTYSFVFSTSENTITKLKQILQSLDTPKETKELKEKTPPPAPSYLLVKLKYISGDQIEEDLESLSNKFKEQKIDNYKLMNVLNNIKWVKETNSILLTGDKDAIDEVKNLIEQYDNLQKVKKTKADFFIYTPKNATIDDIEKYLSNLATYLKTSGFSDPDLLDSIHTMKSFPSNNLIIFTGNEETLNKIQTLLTKFDTSKAEQKKGNFLMFSPKHVSLEDIKNSLSDIANNLKNSGLADPYLLDSIKSMKAVTSTNSLVFTGDEQTLDKIQILLNTIDQPMSKLAIQKLGKINFWIYKIQQASPQHLISSLKSIAIDLSKLDASDKNFIKTLETLRYVKETNSLIFTGIPEALEKIEPLVKKFDIPSEPGDVIQATYFIYKPVYLPGPELEQIIHHFIENLKSSDLDNPSLYEAIDSMKYSEKTKTLMFTGEVGAIEEIKQLLATFDIPNSNFPATKEISGLEDLGFLVYKLQYHKGSEIQNALKQIASDLKSAQGDAASKFKLTKSIEAIQWIEITNSLLCSGDKETLNKLKELINNLDVPLKQVFIEILIIKTTLSNALSFGLEWATKCQYKDKAIMGMSNSVPSTSGTSNFITNMNKINNTTTPNSSNLVFGSGFDLGVIGDILFHKGRSFLSLGSLLAALQNDTETSIVMTPKIIAQDGKTARIFNGSNIPYSGSVVTNQSQNTLVTTNLEYRDVGLDLTITPILGNSDSVTLTINLESSINPASGTSITQLGQVTGITTYKTMMNTSVHVANKNFLVLSGMVRDEKIRAKSGIPCLGGIPLIGAAFSKNDDQKTKDNIVIFVRPHIVNTYEEMQHLTQSQEDMFREQAGSPLIERDFDEATELIKSYENE